MTPDLSSAVALVRSAMASVDRAWNEARENRSGIDLLYGLQEASHSLHRAFAVLTADPTT